MEQMEQDEKNPEIVINPNDPIDYGIRAYHEDDNNDAGVAILLLFMTISFIVIFLLAYFSATR